ncbi:predicted protein [Plenodomus lingam JN3]|uniref:Predicted protein n=1 Tax=Leptosphaeria maculans (strain JN3 / isolate v23.1.3 / race Av1-4-5-6-7-8) TaxID=985895 RepID=E4ZMF4_LEPMJ|nr:predicted protein [Plenodomus lingam JN3]CBX92503.1 predicted protein [Plenodomus lingam JN3]
MSRVYDMRSPETTSPLCKSQWSMRIGTVDVQLRQEG